MKHYKVCKYNYSDNDYMKSWSSIWDVFDSCNKKESIPKYYLDMEKKYLNVAARFIFSLNPNEFSLSEIEDNRCPETEKELRPLDTGLLGSFGNELYQCEGKKITFMDMIYLLQLSLREVVWAKFAHPKGFYIAFGHDYYWLVGVDDGYDINNLVLSEGLFAYEHSDPWE